MSLLFYRAMKNSLEGSSLSDVLDSRQKRIETLETNLKEVYSQKTKVVQENELLKLQVINIVK